MPANVAFLVAFSTGFIGAIVVSAIAVRFTRKLWSLAFGGILSGAALGVLVYVSWNWITFGFELIQVCMLPVAVLILLLVMAAQNWFVFYEDRHDVLQSSRPAIVVLAAIVASLAAWLVTGKHSGSLVLPLIWAGAGSLAMLWCIDPVQRSIERTRSVLLGTLVGVCKVLLPLTGIVIFIQRFEAQQPKPEDFNSSRGRPRAEVGRDQSDWFVLGSWSVAPHAPDQRRARSTLSGSDWIPLKCYRSKRTRSQSPGRCHG